jgi:hypothetical protein
MRATTNGGVTAFKEIQVLRVEDPCIYTVTPDKKSIIEPYVEGKSINVADIMKSSFVFGKGSEQCTNTVDELLTFASDSDYPLTTQTKGDFSTGPTLVLSDATKGKNKFNFAVSSNAKPQVSNEAHVEIIVCGKETLRLADGKTDPVVVEFKKGATDQ